MIFYITYRAGQEHLLPGCAEAVRTHVQGLTRVVVVGPALPADLAGSLHAQGVEWINQDSIYPGLTADIMVVVPRAGSDFGPELFRRLLAWALAYHAAKPVGNCYAVASATFAPAGPVPLALGALSLVPLESGEPDPRTVRTAQGLIGPCQPKVRFSTDYMVFDKRIIEKMIGTLAQLNPRRRLDEMVLNNLNLDDPEFSPADIYGWFAVARYPQLIALRRPDGNVAMLKTPPPAQARTPGGGVFVSFGKPPSP